MIAFGCDDVRDLAGSYVLGALDPALERAVRDHVATCPEPHPELEELGAVAAQLADLAEPVAPPPDLRSKTIAAALAARPAAGPVPAAVAADVPRVAPHAAGERERRRFGWPFAGRRTFGAALAGLAAAVVIVALAAANLLSAQSLGHERDYADQLNRALALAAEPGSRVVAVGGGSGVSGVAVVPSSGDSVLVMQGLPATSGSEVYEAWVIAGATAPKPAGSFTVGADGRGWIASFSAPPAEAIVLGLTREPDANRTTPTLPMVASAKVPAAP